MTNEQAIGVLHSLISYYNDTNEDDCYVGFDKDDNEAIDLAIKALEQESITWIVGNDNCQVAVRNMPIDKMLKICAIIGEEELQPCEDAVSRQAVLNQIFYSTDNSGDVVLGSNLRKRIEKLPSVTPKFTDEEIQKMQELEQAQLEKAYELGKAESFEKWLSSFNTESAPQCFNAVQQLKEKLNGQMD